MTALAPGTRTGSSTDLRSALSMAASVAVTRPSLWLLGGLGFAARGGLLLLALPVMTIPSPVVISILLRDQLGTTGLAQGSDAVLLVAVGFVSAILVACLFLAAYADVAAFELVATDAAKHGLGQGPGPRRVAAGARLDLAITLATIQGAALIPAGVMAVFVAERINRAVVAELTVPSSFASPLAVRVATAAVEPLLALALALIVADVLYALASRAILMRESDPSPGTQPSATRAAVRGIAGLLRRPIDTLVVATLCWMVTLAVVLPLLWATSVAWQGVRQLFLAPGAGSDPELLLASIIATLLFAAVWVAGSLLAGFTSALRSAIWSVDALR